MKKILIYFMIAIFFAGCRPANLDNVVPSPPTLTPHLSRTDLTATAIPIPTQADTFQSAPETPIADEIATSSKGNQMPVFLEMAQTTILGADSTQGPVLAVGPAVYSYNPDGKLLMLHSTITLDPSTKLIIGVSEILQTPNQVYDKKAIIQFPSAQPATLEISAFDVETGVLNIAYAGETFNLSPGESHSFKQVSKDANPSTIITIITNYGQLAGIQPVSPEGSWR